MVEKFHGHFFNNKVISVTEDQRDAIPLYNPGNGELIGKVANGCEKLIDEVVNGASVAMKSWSQVPAPRRARVIFELVRLIKENRKQLAEVITREHGKVLSDSDGEIQRGLEVAEFACGIPHLLKGGFSSQVASGVDSWSMRQPLGVCLGITPFNFPFMVPMWMAPVAIACGNSFILKPSEQDPGVSLLLGELWAEAGLPPGVFNVIQGGASTSSALVRHPLIDSVGFVGSTPIAERINSLAVEKGIRAACLGGAKNHLFVAEDADLDAAVEALVTASFGAAGERCMAISVGVLCDAVADEVVLRLKKRLEQVRVGPGWGLQPEADYGPLISEEHRQRVLQSIDSGVQQGAELVVDGRDFVCQQYPNGHYLGPCLFDRVTTEMDIYRREIFGPVLSMIRVGGLDEGISLINEHQFANGTAVYTQSGATARRFSHEIEVGMVGINVPIPVPMSFYSFGGWRQSNFSQLNMYGEDGVRFYTRLKTMTSRWPESPGARPRSGFAMPN